MYFTRRRGPPDGPQADELPGPHPDLQGRARAPTATCRSATRSRASCIATSRAGRSTASCACATSPRTTPTSSASQDQIEAEVLGCLDFGFFLYDIFGFEPRLELSTRPENRIGSDEMWDPPRARCEGALKKAELDYDVNEGDGAFYGPKIDLHMTRLDRPLVAARHRAARLLDAGALRARVHGRRQRGPPPGDGPPRAARLVRALHRDPDRALRGRVPAVALAGPGGGAADRRPPRRSTRGRWRRSCARSALRAEVDERSESVGRKIRDAELQQGALHAGRGRQGGRGRHRGRAPPPRGRHRHDAGCASSVVWRSTRSSSKASTQRLNAAWSTAILDCE